MTASHTNETEPQRNTIIMQIVSNTSKVIEIPVYNNEKSLKYNISLLSKALKTVSIDVYMLRDVLSKFIKSSNMEESLSDTPDGQLKIFFFSHNGCNYKITLIFTYKQQDFYYYLNLKSNLAATELRIVENTRAIKDQILNDVLRDFRTTQIVYADQHNIENIKLCKEYKEFLHKFNMTYIEFEEYAKKFSENYCPKKFNIDGLKLHFPERLF